MDSKWVSVERKATKLSNQVKQFIERKKLENNAKIVEEKQRKCDLLRLREQRKTEIKEAKIRTSKHKPSYKGLIKTHKSLRPLEEAKEVYHCVDDFGFESNFAESIYSDIISKYDRNPFNKVLDEKNVSENKQRIDSQLSTNSSQNPDIYFSKLYNCQPRVSNGQLRQKSDDMSIEMNVGSFQDRIKNRSTEFTNIEQMAKLTNLYTYIDSKVQCEGKKIYAAVSRFMKLHKNIRTKCNPKLTISNQKSKLRFTTKINQFKSKIKKTARKRNLANVKKLKSRITVLEENKNTLLTNLKDLHNKVTYLECRLDGDKKQPFKELVTVKQEVGSVDSELKLSKIENKTNVKLEYQDNAFSWNINGIEDSIVNEYKAPN